MASRTLPLAAVFALAVSPLGASARAESKTERALKKDAATVDKDIKKDDKKVAHVFSSSEVDSLSKTAQRTYADALAQGKADTDKAIAEAKALYTDAEIEALRAAAKAQTKRYAGFLKKLRANVDAVAKDDGAKALINRVIKAASAKRIDDKTRADMQALGEKLGLIEGSKDAIVPGESGGLFKSSFGVVLGARLGGELAVNTMVGVVADCFKESGKPYGVRGLVEPEAMLGLAASVLPIFLSTEIAIFWQPGSADDAEGLRVGLVVQGQGLSPAGGLVDVRWKVFSDNNKKLTFPRGATAGVPSFYIGLIDGVPQSAAANLEVGHMFTF